jgi:hypothetical protein
MATHTFTFETDLLRGPNEVEIEIEVTYSISAFVPATYWQPAEGGEVEIISVKRNGAEFSTTREEDDILYDRACDRADEDMAEWHAERAEYFADMRREARWEMAA